MCGGVQAGEIRTVPPPSPATIIYGEKSSSRNVVSYIGFDYQSDLFINLNCVLIIIGCTWQGKEVRNDDHIHIYSRVSIYLPIIYVVSVHR